MISNVTLPFSKRWMKNYFYRAEIERFRKVIVEGRPYKRNKLRFEIPAA